MADPSSTSEASLRTQADLHRSIAASVAETNRGLIEQIKLNTLSASGIADGGAAAIAAAESVDAAVREMGISAANAASSAGENSANGTRELFDSLVGVLTSGGNLVMDIFNGINDFAFNPQYIDYLNKTQEVFGGIGRTLNNIDDKQAAKMLSIVKDVKNAVGDMSTTSDMASALGGTSLLRIYKLDMEDAMGTFLDIIQGDQGMLSGVKIMKSATTEMVLEMDILAKGLGYTSEQVSTFVGRQISKTGEANLDMLREAAIYSKKFANATGDNFKFIAANIEAITADTENFGNVNSRETARISSNLRQMGLGFEDLQGSVKKFQTFESAADSVAALTTVFGVQMDAMEMFKLANEDQGELLLRMREQFLATGRSADDLSGAEKRLIAQQLGLQDVESVDRLFDVDAMITNADEAAALMSDTHISMTESLKAMQGSVETHGTPKELLDSYSQAIVYNARALLGADELAGQALVDANNKADEFSDRLYDNAEEMMTWSDKAKKEFAKTNKYTKDDLDTLLAGIADAKKKLAEEESANIIDLEQFEGIEKKMANMFNSSGMFDGIAAGFESVMPKIVDSFQQLVDKIIEVFDQAGILGHSPSPLGESFVKGWLSASDKLPGEMEKVTVSMSKSFKSASDDIKDQFSSIDMHEIGLLEEAAVVKMEEYVNGMNAMERFKEANKTSSEENTSSRQASTLNREGNDTSSNKMVIDAMKALGDIIKTAGDTPISVSVNIDGTKITDYILQNPMGSGALGARLVTVEG
jgi:hypothetical protein